MDQSIISTVKNIVIQHGYSCYLVAQAKRSEGKLSSAIIISINNRCLMTFNQKGNKVTNVFSWLTLSSIKYAKPKLKFYFQKTKCSIIISDENIVKVVSEALQKILLSRELKSIGWTALNLPILPFSPFCAMNRILERASLQKIKISSESTERLFSILIYSQPEIYINDIPNVSSFIDIFFESLPFFPDLYNIAISNMEKLDLYSTLTNYVSYLKDLKRFEIIGPKTDSFSKFFQAFLKHQHFHLFSVSFRNSELDEKDLGVIHDFLVGRNIKGVEFHKAIKKEAMPSLFQFFFNPDLTNNLISLNISESSDIDLNRLILKLNNIQVLSLAKCDVEVGDTLRKLSSLTNLRILDLSNNAFRVKYTSLPPNLTSIYLNSVSWSDQTLLYFVTHLPNHYITLSMCYAKASGTEWATFYNYLPTIHGNFGIESFAFDGNRVHQNLFSFLSENNGLYHLSLNGCFAENNVDSIAALCKFIQTSKSLEELIVRGIENSYLGRYVEQVIASVIQSKNVSYLDISDNKSGDFAITPLRQILATNNKLETLIFDGLLPNSASMYTDFIKNAMNKKSLDLSFPLFDLMHLMNKNQITKQELLQIKDLFSNKSETGTIFKKYPNYNAFPLYLRKDRVSELSDPVEPIAIKPQSKPQTQPKNQNQPQAKNANKNQNQNQKQNQNKNQNQSKPKNQNQNQKSNQQQSQQQQIQQLQQQLQQQQIQQQQLQQQLQQQMKQQQSPKRLDNNNNTTIRNSNSNKKIPPLNITNNNQQKKNKNVSGPDPTLIVDEYDENDMYRYTTYDSYVSDPPASNNNKNRNISRNRRNNRRNLINDYNDYDDYPYDDDEVNYSPIEEITRQRLPARPKSASRYRNDTQNPPQNQTSTRSRQNQQQNSNSTRPQSARKQPRTMSQRRPQSVRRNSDLRGSTKRQTNNNNSGRGSRNINRGGTQRRPNSARPARSASACQMRRPNNNNNHHQQQRDDDFDSYITNNNDNDYYSDINYSDEGYERNISRHKGVRSTNRIFSRSQSANRLKRNNSIEDYEYEDDLNNVNNVRRRGRNKSRSSHRPTKNNFVDETVTNDIVDDYSFDYDEKEEIDERPPSSSTVNKNRIIKVPLRKKKSQNNNNNEIQGSVSFSSDDDDLALKNKPKPALRGKSKPKQANKEKEITRKSPRKNETTTKPALKEFQKQNKMKLRQAQLRQQIKLLEEEEDFNDVDKTTETATTTTTVLSPVTKDKFFAEESNLETTYDIPTWNFPIKMKFEFDDKRTFKIEKTFSTETFIEEILKKDIPKPTKVSKVSKVSRKSSSSK